MTTALERGEGSASRPGRSLPLEKTWYPLYRRLGGPQGRSGQVRKTSPPPEFHHRIVQPVASRYTDYATHMNIVTAKFQLVSPALQRFTKSLRRQSEGPPGWWDQTIAKPLQFLLSSIDCILYRRGFLDLY
jgi:hypothetical protein